LPLLENQVDTNSAFSDEELLYRRVSTSELTGGELDPSRLNSISFDKEIDGAPSVLRGRFSSPLDAIHVDCAGGKDKSDCLVYFMAVGEIPGPLRSGDGRDLVFPIVHRPLPRCGAHSVIGCCEEGNPEKTYVVPSRKVRNDLRAKLATRLLPITQIFDIATKKPITPSFTP